MFSPKGFDFSAFQLADAFPSSLVGVDPLGGALRLKVVGVLPLLCTGVGSTKRKRK